MSLDNALVPALSRSQFPKNLLWTTAAVDIGIYDHMISFDRNFGRPTRVELPDLERI